MQSSGGRRELAEAGIRLAPLLGGVSAPVCIKHLKHGRAAQSDACKRKAAIIKTAYHAGGRYLSRQRIPQEPALPREVRLYLGTILVNERQR